MRRKSFAAEFWLAFIVFMTGGFMYCAIELIYRGHTHPSMFVTGGLALLWVGGLDSFFRKTPPLLVQMLLGGGIITLLEFGCGLVMNVWLRLRVWDYSKLPFNIMGQICPMYFFLWVLISLPAILVENAVRRRFESGLSESQSSISRSRESIFFSRRET